MSVPVLMVAASVLIALTGCGGVGSVDETDHRLFCVATTGSDRNTGVCSAPWKTIQKAVDTLRPGQTALVRAGIYRENVFMRRGGTPNERITLRAYASERVVLRGRLRVAADDVRVVGLRIDGRGLQLATPLVYVMGGRGVTLERLEATRSSRSGILVGNTARDVTVIACWVHDNGTRPQLDHGIVLSRGSGGRVESNVVDHNRAGGILVYPEWDTALVNQNTVIGNGSFGVLVGGERTTSDRILVVNNIVAYNGGQGIRTFWRNDVGRGNAAAYNLIWGNAEDDVSRAGIEQHGNFHAAPHFLDLAAGDFRLQRRSPAVGQALVRYTARIDRNGRPRPQGQRPDLGAYER
jgi:parallel beta-helix repeat protein